MCINTMLKFIFMLCCHNIQMTLAVYDLQTIDQLRTLVYQTFSTVLNKEVKPIRYGNIMPFQNHKSRIVIYQHKPALLQIIWETPSLFKYTNNGMAGFIRRLLQSPSEFSLFNYLKRQGLSYAIKCRVQKTESFYLFYLHLKLTELGLKSVSMVIKAVYDYVRTLKSMDQSDYYRHWENHIKLATVAFEYLMDTSPIDYVM